jgi:outer membrane protein OmpA-like peptidoglycan-associated protein
LFAQVPEAPKLFVLYFREGSTDLIDESNALVPELFEEMKRRPGVDIQVVGHTDTVGDPALNDSLSAQRAQIVRAMLVSMGMMPDLVRASGRGEREPIEPTGDNVASVFNRRVEVYIK